MGRKESDMTEATEQAHMHTQRERRKEGGGREEGREEMGVNSLRLVSHFPLPLQCPLLHVRKCFYI